MHIRICSVVLGAIMLLGVCSQEAVGQITDPVQLESGSIAGRYAPDSSVRAYKGIPYAAPPVGERRWRAPQPPESWEGVREADTFAPGCMQEVVGSRLPWTEAFMHQGDVSEDCLYLNVWTAAASADAVRPVLVWIHGGGFSEGSSSVAVYDGAELAKKGVVVVTINYRLGVFGFLAHPELSAESPNDASGNYGLLDQIAALRWVQQNIAAFGGDPNNVTIAGQSAGAISAYLLTASPRAKGLFHRAILQSGPGALASFGLCAPRTKARPLSKAESAGASFTKEMGASSLSALRAMSASSLLEASTSATGPRRFWPVTGGLVLPEDAATVYARGEQNDVPTLMGLNAHEASFLPGYGETSIEEFRSSARQCFGKAAETFLDLYVSDGDTTAGDAHTTSLRDRGAVALTRLAQRRARTATTDAFLYLFERSIPWPEHPEYGAFHTAEVPYVFNTLDRLDRPWMAIDRRLADTMSSYWIRFAATGDPNGGEDLTWPAFGGAPHIMMSFGKRVGFRPVPGTKARRAFFQEHLSDPTAK